MLKMTNREEYVMQVCNAYDEYLMQTENRGISYGELAYIQSLDQKELDELYEEILEKEIEE